jgi:hypothetical protein
MKRYLLGISVILFTAPLTFSGPSADTDLRPADPRENPPSLSERGSGGEGSLPIVVQRSINGDPELRTQDIRVAGNERRHITLSGYVSEPRLKNKAETLAERVSGVQHVHNNIIVLGGTMDEAEEALNAPTRPSDPLHEKPERE